MGKNELYLTWKHPERRTRYIVGVLAFKNEEYSFKYGYEIEEAIKNGFRILNEFEDKDILYTRKTMFLSFKSRIPSKARKDFKDFLKRREMTVEDGDFFVLKETRGILPTDTLELLEVFPKTNNDNFEFEFYLVGTRYYCKKKTIISKIELVREPNNIYDPYAIKAVDNDRKKNETIGYVPNCYCKELKSLVENKRLNVEVVKFIWDEGNIPDIKIKIFTKV